MVPKDSTKFAVNLQRGADADNADLHLHLGARLGIAPVVVRNTRSRGVWGVEERLDGPFPFPLVPRTFLLVITAYVDIYEIEINGSVSHTFKVRDGLPISDVTHLAIEAQLIIRAIHIPVESMPRNLRLSIPGGARVGDLFFLRGQPTAIAKSFTVNWQNGPAKSDDIIFHLSPRLEEGRVVLNSRTDDEWGSEESKKVMPFKAGTPFSLVVGVSSLGFESSLDGKDFGRFSHRQDSASAYTFFLEGDLQPQDLCIDSAQMDAATTLNGIKLKKRGVRLQHFCPELPLSSRVTGGFEKGGFLLLSGRVAEEPQNFAVNLQCGDGPESDVALKYEIQWREGDPRFILNSREEDTWGKEAPVRAGTGPCLENSFDLLIARLEDCFRVFLDGIEQAEFPYVLEDTLPDHVTIAGDVEVQRVLVL